MIAKKTDIQTRCGMVSIVGRPNVGKSTLLNQIIGEKLAIVTRVPQTTRNQIRGVYTEERGQIIFIDTPGLHIAHDRLDKYMNASSLATLPDADCVIHLVDVNKAIGPEEHMMIERLSDIAAPIILGLNKMDNKGKYTDQYIELWRSVKGEAIHDTRTFDIVPIAGKTGGNIDTLLTVLFEKLPVSEPLYPADTISDVPQKIVIADIIREKLLELLRDEIPHALAVHVVELIPKRRKVMYINAYILLEREAHKEIVIGKKGNVLKKVGVSARRELQDLLERTIYLDLHVKLKKRWRDNLSLLTELGYSTAF